MTSISPLTGEYFKLEVSNGITCNSVQTTTCSVNTFQTNGFQLNTLNLEGDPDVNYTFKLPETPGALGKIMVKNENGFYNTWETPGTIPDNQLALAMNFITETASRQFVHLDSTQTITGSKTFTSSIVLPGIHFYKPSGEILFNHTTTFSATNVIHNGYHLRTSTINASKQVLFSSQPSNTIQIIFLSSDTNVAEYHSKIEITGTDSNVDGDGNITIYATTLDMYRVYTTGYTLYQGNVVFQGSPSDLNKMTGSVPGTAVANSALVTNANQDLEINELYCNNMVITQNALENGYVLFTGSQTIVQDTFTYFADCRTAACSLVLSLPNHADPLTARMIRVIRYAEDETYTLTLDATTTPNVYLQNQLATNIVTTKIMDQFVLLSVNGVGWILLNHFN